jgi:pyridoxamine 5'-phosphate oxidase family protein
MSEGFSDEQIAYITTQRLGRLATVRKDGTVQNNPVGFGYNAALGTIDIGGWNMSASRKYRNVAEGSKVSFVIDDIASLDPWRVRMVEIRGDAEAIGEPSDSASPTAGPIIRIHPRRIISFGLDQP